MSNKIRCGGNSAKIMQNTIYLKVLLQRGIFEIGPSNNRKLLGSFLKAYRVQIPSKSLSTPVDLWRLSEYRIPFLIIHFELTSLHKSKIKKHLILISIPKVFRLRRASNICISEYRIALLIDRKFLYVI